MPMDVDSFKKMIKFVLFNKHMASNMMLTSTDGFARVEWHSDKSVADFDEFGRKGTIILIFKKPKQDIVKYIGILDFKDKEWNARGEAQECAAMDILNVFINAIINASGPTKSTQNAVLPR